MKKKILVTSALPYVNSVPHLGNIIGSVLSADVFARFCRSRGLNTLFICGTDEHGTTTEVKALEEGLTPREVCDKYFKVHSEIYAWFNISFDYFGRTSSLVHHKITQDIFLKLLNNKLVVEDLLEELYCEAENRGLADRFVEGTCPHCGFTSARGDQCEKCGKLLNTFELLNPKCKVCGAKPVKKASKHLFLDLQALQPRLEAWIKVQSKIGGWSDNSIQYTNNWLREGLRKRCISRQLKWGIPIPLKGFEDKVFYVWFDAPIGYISITAESFRDWKDWWLNPESVQLYQFMGKDNVPFHTIVFPATLLGTGEHYTLAHHISASEFLNYEGAKFSKSRGTGVFGDDAMQTGIPSDSFRYYLLVNRPEKSDTTFSWDDFSEKHNSELIANLGNLVNRTMVFLEKYYGLTIPGGAFLAEESELLKKARVSHAKIEELLGNVKIKDALREVMALSMLGNKYFQDSKPWKSFNDDKPKCDRTMLALVNFIKDIAILIEPFMPQTCRSILDQLDLEHEAWSDLGKASVIKGHKVKSAKPLFNKLLDKDKDMLKMKFGGKKKSEDDVKEASLDLRVAQIIKAETHPKAERLVVLHLSLGEFGNRQIVAGIRQSYSCEDLPGKKIIIVSNLKPASIRGVESNGMLLACGSDAQNLGLLTINNARPGSRAGSGGYEANTKVLSIEEFASFDFEGKDGLVYLSGRPLTCEGENVLVEKGAAGKIK